MQYKNKLIEGPYDKVDRAIFLTKNVVKIEPFFDFNILLLFKTKFLLIKSEVFVVN